MKSTQVYDAYNVVWQAYVCRVSARREYMYAWAVLCMKRTRRVCSATVGCTHVHVHASAIKIPLHGMMLFTVCISFHAPAKKGTSPSDYRQVGTTSPPTKTTSLGLADYR